MTNLMYRKRDRSEQLSLGELIELIEKSGVTYNSFNDDNKGILKEKIICYDFPAYPTDLDSYRGYYNHLALGFTFEYVETSALTLLKKLKDSIGETFYGYKGDEYQMFEDTPLWVANYGKSGHTGITGLINVDDYMLVILTEYME